MLKKPIGSLLQSKSSFEMIRTNSWVSRSFMNTKEGWRIADSVPANLPLLYSIYGKRKQGLEWLASVHSNHREQFIGALKSQWFEKGMMNEPQIMLYSGLWAL